MADYPVLLHTAIDARDCRGLAEFYRQLLGLHYRPGDESPGQDDWLVLLDDAGRRVLTVQRKDDTVAPTWPSEEVPMQMHHDFVVASVDELERHRRRAEELGARVLHDRTCDADEPLYVLADPAGHPFCLLVQPIPAATGDHEGAWFERQSFKGATFRACDVSGVTMRSVDLDGLDVDSHDLMFGTLVVNGVDVVPLVEAELDRLFPGRELQKATTPDGLREGWVAVQEAWATTVADTPATLVDAHVDDEWSLAQTLRHLVLATDTWLRGAILGVEQPWHEIGLIFTGADRMGFDMSVFRSEPPMYDEVLEVRAGRQQLVTDFLATATPELLAEERTNPWSADDDWRPTVGDCVRVILEEEWAHLRYIRRDLAELDG